ncbi:MAG: flagellar biosynthesis protein FliQ [Rickettsiales bacterium]
MDKAEIFSISHDALETLMVISAPVMIAAMVVGLIISLIQALTQIQETTLTFVPKIFAVFITLSLAVPFMLDNLAELNNRIHDRIVHID